MDEVKQIADIARKLFFHDGYHVPLVFVKGTQGKVFFELVRFGETSIERELDMLHAGTLIARKRNVGDLELLIHVCEGWMGTNINIRPTQDPNRKEVLLVNSLDVRTQEEKLLSFAVKRDPNGTVLDLKELVLPDLVETKGRLLPAFLKGYQLVSPVHN